MSRFFILLTLILPAAAQTNLSVNTIHMSSSSLAFSWSNISSPWTIGLSSNSFSSLIFQGGLAATSTSYASLTPNTTYWFRVKVSAEPDTSYTLNTVSTITYATIPQSPAISYKNSEGYQTSEIRIGFTTLNPAYTRYLIEYSSDAANNYAYITGAPPIAVPNLLANTTYTIRLQALDSLNRTLGYSSSLTTSTLSIIPPSITNQIFETSATVSWTALNSATRELSCEGYDIIVSTNADFRDSVYIWSTSNNNTNSDTPNSLARNTTHYMRIGSLNWNSEKNYSSQQFTTLAYKPQNFSLLTVSSGSASLGWTKIDDSPQENSAAGYILEASTTNPFSVIATSVTYNLSLSTLAFSALSANTTHYFRAASLNMASQKNYTVFMETVTLSMGYSVNDIGLVASTKSVTAYFYPLDETYEFLSGKGYLLQISTLPFTTGVILSSATSVINTSNLTIDNLKGNTSYYVRLGTYNRNMAINFSGIKNILTLTPPAVDIAYISTKTFNSARIIFSTGNTDGYSAEASRDEFFTNIAASSNTTVAALSTLTISGLSIDTSYYFRLGSIFQGSTVYYLLPAAYTLSSVPTAPTIDSVFITSITLIWGSVTSSGYRLEASTSAAFLGTIYSSSTNNPAAASLSILSLTPNTSYYLRVGGLNQISETNFISFPTTSTLANFPIQTLPFTTADLSTGSIKIKWNPNSNPSDTDYLVRISSFSTFTDTVFSSTTKNAFASFSDLQPNTTFFQEITAFNRLSRLTGPIQFSSVATLAFDPSPSITSPLVYQSSITFYWNEGLNPPPPNTLYFAEISQYSDFSQAVTSTTLNLSAYFSNLTSNATHYMRVSALNQSGISSNYVTLASTLTYVKIPANLAETSKFSLIKLDGFSSFWSENNNASDTVYEIAASTASNFSVINSSGTVFIASHSFSGLNANTEYFVRVRSKGKRNELSSWLTVGSTTTLSRIQQQVYPQETTTISLPYSYGDIIISIPSNAIGGATKITLEPEYSFSAPLSNAGIMRATGVGVKINSYPPTIFDHPVTITIPYLSHMIPAGYDRNKLVIASQSDTSDLWVPLSSVSDTLNNKVSGRTFHFSKFQIMELTPGQTLSDIKIYPNPYKPNTNAGRMNFTNLPPGTKIKIFTINGELLKKLTSGADGMAQWDGKNENNNFVASGVYVIVFKDPSGKTKTKKAAIER